jgi:hypothetical protein
MIGSVARTVGLGAPIRIALGALALACAATRLSAQEGESRRDGWIVGPLVGVPGVGSEPFTQAFTLGVGGTRLVPNRPGADLAIGIVPRFLPEGAVVLGARAGVGIPLALTQDVFLVPSAGLSAAGGFGSGGGGGTGGVYGGAAAVIASGSLGFRAGITLHSFGGGNSMLWLMELGLMHVPLPSARRGSP